MNTKTCRSGRHEMTGHNIAIRGGVKRCRACADEHAANYRKNLRDLAAAAKAAGIDLHR